ncbi:MAG: NAD(P)H-dependent flavin oxidoreductase [Desulfovibrionales bacterium]
MAFPPLKIGDLVAKIPIIQGGMGVGISLSGLASAVAKEGGIGVIAAAMIGMNEPDVRKNFREANTRALAREIRKARELSRGILGVNIMVALTTFADLVRTAVQEKVDVIFSGAGLPLDLPKYLPEQSKTKLVPIVSSARAAGILCRKWLARYKRLPDGFVVEGPKAGGHLGFKPEQLDDPSFSLERLVQDVLGVVRPYEEDHDTAIPVIAAGGIYSGKDVCKFLELGASGVQMGTRFVTTDECDADIAFKQSYLKAKKEDMVVIKSPVGMPGRAINNEFLESVSKGERKPISCPYHCISTCEHKKSPYCIAAALLNAQKGILSQGFAFAGVNAYLSDKIVSVRQLIQTLYDEYEEACTKIKSTMNPGTDSAV